MKILLFLSLFFAVPLLWDACSSASANRGLQGPEVLPAMRIQIRSGGASTGGHPERIKPGETLYFSQVSRQE